MDKSKITDFFILFLLASLILFAGYAVSTEYKYNKLVVEYNEDCKNNDKYYGMDPIWMEEENGEKREDGFEFKVNFTNRKES